MPRKTLNQIAADARKRTAKWRESRAAMRLPEARSIDKAALEAMFYVGRQNGNEFMVDLAGLKDITTYAVKLLTFSYHDDDTFQYDLKAVTAVVGKRLIALKKANNVSKMIETEKRRARYAAENVRIAERAKAATASQGADRTPYDGVTGVQ